jgi:hypothetical protein
LVSSASQTDDGSGSRLAVDAAAAAATLVAAGLARSTAQEHDREGRPAAGQMRGPAAEQMRGPAAGQMRRPAAGQMRGQGGGQLKGQGGAHQSEQFHPTPLLFSQALPPPSSSFAASRLHSSGYNDSSVSGVGLGSVGSGNGGVSRVEVVRAIGKPVLPLLLSPTCPTAIHLRQSSSRDNRDSKPSRQRQRPSSIGTGDVSDESIDESIDDFLGI